MNQDSGTQTSRARPAASVILARPSAGGFEVFMLRRSSRSSFVPDAFVFPGGTMDDDDASDATRARTLGLDAARLRSEFRATVPNELPADGAIVDEALASGLSIAALRELFEEAGVALARTASGAPLGIDAHERMLDARERLRAGSIAFVDVLRENDWYADAAALTYFSHWITPPTEPRRYDTHFFLATAPDQAARADADETHDGVWIAPHEALSRYRDGSFRLVYPTIKHLERFTAFSSLDTLAEFARSKPVLTIMPTGSPYDDFAMPASLENAW